MTKNKKILSEKIINFLCIFFFAILFCFQLHPAKSLNDNYNSDKVYSVNCSKNNKQYLVKNVLDGDTILLENNEKIRLLGIDAFEYNQFPYGKFSLDFLKNEALNKKVCIETDVQKKDIYNRTLGYVFISNKNLNEEILKTGNALLYDFPPNTKYIKQFKKAQIYARKNMLGIWENQNYIFETPYQFRHKTKR